MNATRGTVPFVLMISVAKRVVSVLMILVLVLAFRLAGSAQSQSGELMPADGQMLILVGAQYGIPVVDAIMPPLVGALVSGGMSREDIFVEFLDLHRFPGERHRAEVMASLRSKLLEKDIRLIVTINQSAVDFLAQEGHDFFPDAPMLIPIFEQEPAWVGVPRRVIILSSRVDAEGTLRFMFNLFPETRRIIIIMGKDDYRAPFYGTLRAALDALPGSLDIKDTSAFTYEEMLQYIASLPANTVAIYGSYFADVAGQTFVPAEVAAQVARTANVPVFALREVHIAQGLFGGSIVGIANLGSEAAEIGLSYKSGRLSLTEQTTSMEVFNFPLFDWQQLMKWRVDQRNLPAYTVFLNYTPTLWSHYRDLIVVTFAFMLVLLGMLVLLLVRNQRLKTAEQGLLAYSTNLDRLVAERTAQLDAKAKELEIFAYSVAHDLKAPLRGIDGYSRLLLVDYHEKLDGEGSTFLKTIRLSVERMNRLIDDLLAYSRLESREWREASFSLRRLVESAAIDYAEEIRRRDGTININVPEVYVSVDREGLLLIVRNLLDNALKYTPPSQGPVIDIGAVEGGKIITLFVRDQGIGFDMKYQEQIFGIFNRLHNQEEYPGTGIGLAMVRKASVRLGGRVWAESQAGKGATFYLEMPRKKAESPSI